MQIRTLYGVLDRIKIQDTEYMIKIQNKDTYRIRIQDTKYMIKIQNKDTDKIRLPGYRRKDKGTR